MPWTPEHPPAAMAHLPPVVKAKAVEIAYALLERGHDDGHAIRIAITAAWRWARRRGLA